MSRGERIAFGVFCGILAVVAVAWLIGVVLWIGHFAETGNGLAAFCVFFFGVTVPGWTLFVLCNRPPRLP